MNLHAHVTCLFYNLSKQWHLHTQSTINSETILNTYNHQDFFLPLSHKQTQESTIPNQFPIFTIMSCLVAPGIEWFHHHIPQWLSLHPSLHRLINSPLACQTSFANLVLSDVCLKHYTNSWESK